MKMKEIHQSLKEVEVTKKELEDKLSFSMTELKPR